MPAVVQEEHAPHEDLLKDPPVNALRDVPQVHDGSLCLGIEGSLLEVLRRQAMQEVLFAFKELEEIQAGLRPAVNNGTGTPTEHSFAPVWSISEEPQATICRLSGCQLPQATPGDALD